MKYISFFENLTRASIKDCILDDERLIFVVGSGELAKAIGKQGAHVRKASGVLKKQIKLVEYSEDVCQFVKNYLLPLKVHEVTQEDTTVTIACQDAKTKGAVFGRDRKSFSKMQDIVSRYFDVSLKVK